MEAVPYLFDRRIENIFPLLLKFYVFEVFSGNITRSFTQSTENHKISCEKLKIWKFLTFVWIFNLSKTATFKKMKIILNLCLSKKSYKQWTCLKKNKIKRVTNLQWIYPKRFVFIWLTHKTGHHLKISQGSKPLP